MSTVDLPEFARRLCLANHRRDFDNANQADKRVPCGQHLAEARATIFLTTPAGAKSLNVIIDCFPPAEPARSSLPGEDLRWLGLPLEGS